jgi:hypothetical protein
MGLYVFDSVIDISLDFIERLGGKAGGAFTNGLFQDCPACAQGDVSKHCDEQRQTYESQR